MLEHQPPIPATLRPNLSADTGAVSTAAESQGKVSAWVEDYLDRIYAPLVGRLAYAKRQEIRTEIGAHLEELIAAHQELGSDLEEATQAALRQFGPPETVALQWLPCRKSEPEAAWLPTAATVKPAFRRGAFVLGSGIALWSIVGILCIEPVSNPSPSVTASFLTMGALLPVVTGLLVGRTVKHRPVLGMLLAQAAILPFAPVFMVALGCLVTGQSLPNLDGIVPVGLGLFAALATTGCLGAFIGARLKRLAPRRYAAV